jgi:phage terminase large subunit-like protein
MPMTYILHTNGSIGKADIPDWLNFDEQPPRSFDIYWINLGHRGRTTTEHTVRITKEVADIMRDV